MLTVLITGSREWMNLDAMIDELAQLPVNTILVHGDCRGADRMARDIGKELGFTVISYPANWTKYGTKAGPIRNRQMFDESKPDLVLAFHENLAQSKGTKDMVQYAQSKGATVKIITG